MGTNTSGVESLQSAALWNGGMAACQLGLTVISGNTGFASESAHNISDALSFQAKARAESVEAERPRGSVRLRRFAAGILLAGGLGSVASAGYNAAVGNNEDADTVFIAAAVIGSAINTKIALKAQRAVLHTDDHGHHGALEDGKLHAVVDAGTGWLYTASLLGEHGVPGVANCAVILNGAITTFAALKMLNNSRVDKDYSTAP